MNNSTNTTSPPYGDVIAELVLSESTRPPVIVGHLVLFVLCFAYRKHNPIRSRSIIPYIVTLGNIYYMLSLAVVSFILLNYPVYIEATCYRQIVFTTPVELAAVIICSYQFLRFLVMNRLSRDKVAFRNDITTDTSLQLEDETNPGTEVANNVDTLATEDTSTGRKLSESTRRLLSAIISLPFSIVFSIVYCTIIGIILLVTFLVENRANLNNPSKVTCLALQNDLLYWFVGAILIVLTFALLLIIVDVIVNFKHFIRLRLKHVFIVSDPLVFRLEFYLYVLMHVAFWIARLIPAIATKNALPAYVGTITHIVTLDILSLFISPFIPLVKTIYWTHNNKDKELDEIDLESPTSTDYGFFANYKRNAAVLRRLVENKTTRSLFKQFTVREYSVENLLLYLDIQKFKKLEKTSARKKMAEKIGQLYLKDGTLQVNLATTVLKKTEQVIKDIQALEKIDENALFDLEIAVTDNLLDSYSRFYYTAPFQKYIAKLNV